MRNRNMLGICLLVVYGFTIQAAKAQDLTLDQILSKNEAALGGAEAIGKVQSLKMTAKMMVNGGQMEVNMTIQAKRPNMVRTESAIQGKSIIAAFDGTTGWMINPLMGSSAPQKMDDKTTASMSANDLDDSIGSLSHLKAAGSTVELLGKDTVEGTAAYKVKVTRKNGMTATQYLDAETFLPIKVVAKVAQMGQEVEVESYPSNYKKVEGVLFPFASDQKMNGRSVGQLIIEKVEINVPMDDAIFKMPAESKPPKEK